MNGKSVMIFAGTVMAALGLLWLGQRAAAQGIGGVYGGGTTIAVVTNVENHAADGTTQDNMTLNVADILDCIASNLTLQVPVLQDGTSSNLVLQVPVLQDGISSNLILTVAIIRDSLSSNLTLQVPVLRDGLSSNLTLQVPVLQNGTSSNLTLKVPILQDGTSSNLMIQAGVISNATIKASVMTNGTYYGNAVGLTNLQLTGNTFGGTFNGAGTISNAQASVTAAVATNGPNVLAGVWMRNQYYGTGTVAFAAAIAVADSNDVIRLGEGRFGQYDFGGGGITVPGLTIVGSGVPNFNTNLHKLIGGTIMTGPLTVSTNGAKISNMGFEHVPTQNGLILSVTSNSNLLNAVIDNLAFATTSTNGNASEALYVTGDGLVARNLTFYNEPAHIIVLKGVRHVYLSDFLIKSSPPTWNNYEALLVYATDKFTTGDTFDVHIQNGEITGVLGPNIKIQRTGSARIHDIYIGNISMYIENSAQSTKAVYCVGEDIHDGGEWYNVKLENISANGPYRWLSGFYAYTNFCAFTNTFFLNCNVTSTNLYSVDWWEWLASPSNPCVYWNNCWINNYATNFVK